MKDDTQNQDGVGIRIKQVRNYYRQSQEMFGENLGVTHAHISKIESEKERPSKTLKILISKLFFINYEWLENGTGEMLSKEDMEHMSLIQDMFEARNALREMVDSMHDLIYHQFIFMRRGQ